MLLPSHQADGPEDDPIMGKEIHRVDKSW